MARVIVNNTRFTPFTFEEMLRPIAMYGQEYRAQEAALSELAIKANVFEGMANEQTDPYAYKVYKKYADDLESQAGQLSREGLSLSSRKNMLQMRERYSKEITPIEVAYKRREELAAEQRKAIAANPTLRYQRMAGAMSLDDFIKNPSLDYGESYSGALLTQQAAQAAANYAKVLTEEGGLEKLGLPYQYKSKIRHGASPEEILAVINDAALDGHQGAVNFLRTIKDQVMQSSGVADWADPSTLREFTSFANQGLYSALGQTEIKNYTDQFSMHDALNARQHARTVAAQRAAAAGVSMRDPHPSKLFTSNEIAKMNAKEKTTLENYIKKGYFNSKGQLTRRGMKALQGDGYIETEFEGIPTRMRAADVGFKQWALTHGQTQANINKGIVDPALNRYFRSTMANINADKPYDGTPNIDIYRSVQIKGKGNQDYVLSKVINSLSGASIKSIENGTVDKNGAVTLSGKSISSDKFDEMVQKDPILYISNSPMTNSQIVELRSGKRFELPAGSLSDTMFDQLNRVANLDDPNDPMGINQRLLYAGSAVEQATLLNQAGSYMGTLLDSSKSDDKGSTIYVNN